MLPQSRWFRFLCIEHGKHGAFRFDVFAPSAHEAELILARKGYQVTVRYTH